MSRIKAMRDSDKKDFQRFEIRYQEVVMNKGSDRPHGQAQDTAESIILQNILEKSGHKRKPQKQKRAPKTETVSKKSATSTSGWDGFEDNELGRKSDS